jgi:ketosteroid isomerase-like protein
VAVQNTAHLRGRNGIEVKARSTIVFTFRNDKVSELRLYQDDAAARAAMRAAGD